MTIYLDMDGVLMGFEEAIGAHGVARFPDGMKYIHLPHDRWPPEMVAADAAYVECMSKSDFWNTIEPLADAHELWNFVAGVSPGFHILSATPPRIKDQTILDRVTRQKRESIWGWFDASFPASRIDICARADKAKYARPGDILIDDTPGNCAEWEAAGGIAILHKNAIETITELRRLLAAADHVRSRQVEEHDKHMKPKLRALTSAERKAAPVHTGVMLYFPDALMAVARVSKRGNDKHNPGEPLHWARNKSTDQTDCVARHMLTPDAVDPDSGEVERAHAAWRALADLQLAEERRLVAAGIMPLSGITE